MATTTTSVLAQLGTAGLKAHAKHKGDTTTLESISDLPPGIDSGIAHLVDIKFAAVAPGKTNAGKPFFYAAAICKRPLEVIDSRTGEKVSCKGGRTSITEMLIDEPKESAKSRKTVDDKWAYVLSVLRTLGVDTSKLPDDNSMYLKVDQIVQHLKKTSNDGTKPIFFKFRTYIIPKRKPGEKGYTEKYDGPNSPPSRVNHSWGERVEFADVADPAAGVTDDQTVADDVPVEELGANLDAVPTDAGDFEAEVTAEVAAADGITDGAAEDLDALVELANKQDAVAQNKLVDLAVAAGHAREAAEADDVGWSDIKTMIENPVVEEVVEEVVVAEPEKGKTRKYKVIDPKTKKPIISAKTKKEAAPIDVEILAVDKKKKIANVKSLVDGKTLYNAVPFDQLIEG